MHFDFTDLRLFIAVAEAGSITAGADRACLSLASASARIRGLEQQAGIQLWPAARGEYKPHRPVNACWAMLVCCYKANGYGGIWQSFPGQRLPFAYSGQYRRRHAFLPELLADYLLLNPQTDIVLEELPSTAISQSILDQTADIGIVANHADLRGLESYPFRQDRLRWRYRYYHPLAGRASVCFSETLAYDFIGLSDDSALQQHLAQHALRNGGPMRLRARAGSFEVVCRMVTRGAGIAVVPEIAPAMAGHASQNSCAGRYLDHTPAALS